MVKHSRRHNKKRGGNSFTSSYADAAGLQTTGASNYAAATNASPGPSPSPIVKGGSSKARGKSMSKGMGKSMSQSQSRAKGRGRSQGIGGFWGAVLEQAIVPLTLLGIQQTYGRKRHLKGRTFKRRHH
jgi:hypothetical protein